MKSDNPDKAREEFELLLTKLDPKEVAAYPVWEKAAYFAFFLHGWYGRTNDAEYQKK